MKKLILALLFLANTANAESIYDVDSRIKDINWSVNHSMIYESEKDDKWRLLDGKNKRGDCEDFAITKIHELAKIGIKARVVVYRMKSENHAVAVVGKWALDNRNDSIYEFRAKPITQWELDFARKVARLTHIGTQPVNFQGFSVERPLD